jgi:hypothetical protein
MKDKMIIKNVPVDPDLPSDFLKPFSGERPTQHTSWVGNPFILSTPNPHFTGGIRYDVFCLESGGSDRPIVWGMFPTIDEAVERAKVGPPWRKPTR